jgi:hypothetical protein
MVPRRQRKETWKVIEFEIGRVLDDDSEGDGLSHNPGEPGTRREQGKRVIPGEEFLLPLSLSSRRPTARQSASRMRHLSPKSGLRMMSVLLFDTH